MTLDRPFDVFWLMEGADARGADADIGPIKFVLFTIEADQVSVETLKKKLKGTFRDELLTTGWPALWHRTYATDAHAAVRSSHKVARLAADLLSLHLPLTDVVLSLGPDRAPALTGFAVVRQPGNDETEVYNYGREILFTLNTDGQADQLTNAFNRDIVGPTIAGIPPRFFEEDASEIVVRVKRSLRWWSESRRSPQLVAKFLFAWIAMESLISDPDEEERGRSSRLRKRMYLIGRAHGSGFTYDELQKVWNLRKEVIHEAAIGYFDRGSKHGPQIGAHLNDLRYFIAIVMGFLLDMMPNATSLKEAWSRANYYRPPKQIRPKDIPARFVVVDYIEGPGLGVEIEP